MIFDREIPVPTKRNFYRCDRCGIEEMVDSHPGFTRSPNSWGGYHATGDLDFCPSCTAVIDEAIKVASKLPSNITPAGSIAGCDCGGAKASTPHSSWCLVNQ